MWASSPHKTHFMFCSPGCRVISPGSLSEISVRGAWCLSYGLGASSGCKHHEVRLSHGAHGSGPVTLCSCEPLSGKRLDVADRRSGIKPPSEVLGRPSTLRLAALQRVGHRVSGLESFFAKRHLCLVRGCFIKAFKNSPFSSQRTAHF